MAPGRYFLVAKGGAPFPDREPGVGELFGYYGGNPVRVGEGAELEANLLAVARTEASVQAGGEPGGAVLEGIVRGPEGPVEGAYLHVYPDAARDFRGPDLFGPQGPVLGGTGPDGAFSVELPPGRYFLVASKRQGALPLGPLQVGDLHGYYDGNPLELRGGQRARVIVQLGEKLRDVRSGPGGRAGLRGVAGVLKDAEGQVPAGVYAYASAEPNLMTGMMPPFRSDVVGPDGGYFIDLPEPGTYYVGARSGYGGPPLPGEWFGIHGEGQPAPVTVEGDRVTEGIDVTVRRME